MRTCSYMQQYVCLKDGVEVHSVVTHSFDNVELHFDRMDLDYEEIINASEQIDDIILGR